MEVFKDCKLSNGNIPRTFEKLDTFVTVADKKKTVEIEESKETEASEAIVSREEQK